MPGLVMPSGNCINAFVTAVKPAKPKISIARLFPRFVLMHRPLLSSAWIPGSRMRKRIWSVEDAIVLGVALVVVTPRPMARPRDLRQWWAGSFCRIQRGLPSYWIDSRRPNPPCHNHRSHELPLRPPPTPSISRW